MDRADSKVIILADYSKARALLTLEDVEHILDDRKTGLRQLEAAVIKTVSRSHKLKDIQKCKDESVKIEGVLINASDWLEDKTKNVGGGTQRESAQTLLKQCEQLMARSERIKKTIADDMAACRYAESKGILNPAQAMGAIVSIVGGTAVFVGTVLKSRPEDTAHAAEAAAAVGIYAAYHKRINRGFMAAASFVAKSPQRLGALKRKARSPIYAATLTASVTAKQVSEIRPRHPSSNTVGPKVTFSAKL